MTKSLITLATMLLAGSLAFAQAGRVRGPMKGVRGPMKGFVNDIEEMTEKNSDFRRVLYTAKKMQLVLMALQPGEEIGEEVHDDGDQFFRVEKGKGEVWIDGTMTKIESETAIVIPAGARHNIKNTGEEPLKLYTIYAPPEHRDGTVQATKANAEASQEHFDGKTTEWQITVVEGIASLGIMAHNSTDAATD